MATYLILLSKGGMLSKRPYVGRGIEGSKEYGRSLYVSRANLYSGGTIVPYVGKLDQG